MEQGTYSELIAANGYFAKFIAEFGTSSAGEVEDAAKPQATRTAEKPKTQAGVQGKTTMMQSEERATGSVSWKVYKAYFAAANLEVVFPLLIIAILLFQGASVLSPYWLVFWQEERFPIPQGAYMAIYAVLGFMQAFGLFCMGGVFAVFTFYASQSLHRDALDRMLHAPISFFDTTPLGRIMNRFSKGIFFKSSDLLY
ncbi:hypothetical protein FRC08_016804 [Ceratobasidium sp. 394]|nr:hypothetical protein FRC08_016804 [Ceratobasidium sp. 394]